MRDVKVHRIYNKQQKEAVIIFISHYAICLSQCSFLDYYLYGSRHANKFDYGVNGQQQYSPNYKDFWQFIFETIRMSLDKLSVHHELASWSHAHHDVFSLVQTTWLVHPSWDLHIIVCMLLISANERISISIALFVTYTTVSLGNPNGVPVHQVLHREIT